MRILVVEDEVKFAAFFGAGAGGNGQAVDAVHDGEEGLRRALSGEYDLLVLDWLLPGRDGGSLCAAVRGQGAMSRSDADRARRREPRVAGLDAGADDYLTKPFVLVEMLARVRALLRRGAPGRRTDPCGPDAGTDDAPGPARRRATLRSPPKNIRCWNI